MASNNTKRGFDPKDKRFFSEEAVINRCILIDGFNIIITLEVALSGNILILGKDGVLYAHFVRLNHKR